MLPLFNVGHAYYASLTPRDAKINFMPFKKFTENSKQPSYFKCTLQILRLRLFNKRKFSVSFQDFSLQTHHP